MALLADEDLIGKTPKQKEVYQEDGPELCYYKNEFGQICFGFKPKKQNINYGFFN